MSDSLILYVTYAYGQTVFPREGGSKINGTSRDWIGTDPISVDRASRSEFEEVATLSFSGGGFITLLSRDGQLYRPVMAPGEHRGCDETDLVEAAKAGQPWRDDPFVDREGRYGLARDTNDPPETSLGAANPPDPQNWRKLGESKRAGTLAGIQARSGSLVIVDGILHVACPEPTLLLKSIAADGDEPAALRLEWALPRMEGDDDPETGPTTVKLESRTTSYASVRGRGNHRYADPRPPKVTGPRVEWGARPWRKFGLADLAEATRFGEAMAAEAGVDFEARRDLAVLHAPSLLSEGVRLDRKSVADRAYNALAVKVEKLSREAVADWLDARDARAAQDHAGVIDAVERAVSRPADRKLMTWGGSTDLTVLSASSYGDEYGRDAQDAMANMLRFVMVERDRAASPGMDEADADAFAEVGGFTM